MGLPTICLLENFKQKTQYDNIGYHIGLFIFFGSDGRDRTYDQLINSQLLYR
jgi:hypothetical protein